MEWAIELKLFRSLSPLLRFAAKYSVATLVSTSTHSAASALSCDGLWVPSNGMIACAISALCCGFTYENLYAKQCFVSAGDAAAAVLGTGGAGRLAIKAPAAASSQGGGTALHQLISVGISRSFVPATRWLCLAMAGSLLSGARTLGMSTTTKRD